jgi:hypothetical protein
MNMVLKVIPRQPPWEALILPASFPMADPETASARRFLSRLTAALAQEWKLKWEVFLQFTELHQRDGTQRLTDHGKEWIPGVGLGVWPDRPPPTIWTREVMEQLKEGESPPTLMYQVFRVTTGLEARDKARDVMLGLGTVIQIMTTDDTDAFLGKTRRVLLPPIQDPAFTCFPYYIPMFGAASLQSATAAQMEEWSCGAMVYIRESYHDKGIVIGSRQGLGPVLQKMDGRFSKDPEPAWQMPG